MTKDETIKRIAAETGISPERLLIERRGQLAHSVDVLHGTTDERWAAAAALKKCSPVGVATIVHEREAADPSRCSRCGTRIKVVEQYNRKTRSISARSRCSNPLCPNGKHWMPAYRPVSTQPSSPAMALVVDRGDDEPSDWLPPAKPKMKTWGFNPPDKIAAPVFKNPPPPEALDINKAICEEQPLTRPEQNRCAHQLAAGVWVQSRTHGWLGRLVEAYPGTQLWAVKFEGRCPCGGVDERMDFTTEELVRDYDVVPDPHEKSVLGVVFPQLNQWIRHKATYRSGCISFHEEHHVKGVHWGVRFKDTDYPVLLTTEELVENYEPDAVSAIMNPPAPKAADTAVMRPLNSYEREKLRKLQTEQMHKMWDSHAEVEAMQQKVLQGLNVPKEYLDGNFSTAVASAYGKVMSPALMSKLKETASKVNYIGTCTGRLSSSAPNQASLPRQEHIYTEGMLVKNKDGVCGRLRRVPGESATQYWQVQDIHLSTKQLPSGDDRTELMTAVELVYKGWKPYTEMMETDYAQLEMRLAATTDEGVFKTEYMGEFQGPWPDHLDNRWVGRRLIHRESGAHVQLGNYVVGFWHVHVPYQGTWRFSEQDIFKLFYPAPPEKEPSDLHQQLADKLGVSRNEAKKLAFASNYGMSSPFTKYPLAGFSKSGKKDPKQG